MDSVGQRPRDQVFKTPHGGSRLKIMKKAWILMFEKKEGLAQEFEGSINNEGNQKSYRDRNDQEPNTDSLSRGG